MVGMATRDILPAPCRYGTGIPWSGRYLEVLSFHGGVGFRSSAFAGTMSHHLGPRQTEPAGVYNGLAEDLPGARTTCPVLNTCLTIPSSFPRIRASRSASSNVDPMFGLLRQASWTFSSCRNAGTTPGPSLRRKSGPIDVTLFRGAEDDTIRIRTWNSG
jgi:hypothetical protein